MTDEQVFSIVDGKQAGNNVPPAIRERLTRRLHLQDNHPLATLLSTIRDYWSTLPSEIDGTPQPSFECFDSLAPVVSVQQNFDDLLTPDDHVSRQTSDTFYVSKDNLLRCHMTAHQTQLLRDGHRAFLMAGDVYRRDTIDATHYPVFHQCDGVRVFDKREFPADELAEHGVDALVMRDLKGRLEGMARALFGDVEMRWVDAYFPFTEPSAELEIFFEGEWLEVLGCGKIRSEILGNCGIDPEANPGWAFGLGLERLAMVKHDIGDIRLFWTQDRRFLDQFPPGATDVKFQPYSKYPACYKDMTFWVPESYHEHDLFELFREVAGDLVESVECIDEFTHPKTGRDSKCYRTNYRSMDRSLTNEEVDALQFEVRDRAETELGVEFR